MLVQSSAELLARLCELLLQLVRLEGDGIPFVLEGGEEGGDGGERRRAGTDDALRLELDKVIRGKLLAIDGVGAVLGDVRFDQTLLEDISCGSVSCCSRVKQLGMYEPLFLDATGTCGASPETELSSAELAKARRGARLTCAQHSGGGCWVWGATAWSLPVAERACEQELLGSKHAKIFDEAKPAKLG